MCCVRMRSPFSAALLALAFAGTACAESLQRFVFEKAAMGLPFRVTLFAADEAQAKAAADAAFERIAVLNSIFSDYDPESELSRLSRTSGQAVPVSRDLWKWMIYGQREAETAYHAIPMALAAAV